MYTFIILSVGFALWLLLYEDGLISRIKNMSEYNKAIQCKILNKDMKSGFFESGMGYSEKDYDRLWKAVGDYILWNIFFGIFCAIILYAVSGLIVFCLPTITTSYEFQINSLKDDITVDGKFYGRRGYIDGDLSYFYSRTFKDGEGIRHIPASKTYIDYNNDVHPKIAVYQEKREISETLSKFLLREDDFNIPVTTKYIMTVPEGTIEDVGVYNIDMK